MLTPSLPPPPLPPSSLPPSFPPSLSLSLTYTHSLFQGDTLQNVAGELDCILSTGTFVFKMNSDTSSQGVEILLQYSPSTSTQPSYSHSPIQP